MPRQTTLSAFRQKARVATLQGVNRLQGIAKKVDNTLLAIKGLTILKEVLLFLARLCFIAGGALIAWLCTRVLERPAADSQTQKPSSNTNSQTQPSVPLTLAPFGASSGAAAVAYRWNISPVALAAILVLFFAVTVVVAYFAFRRGSYYLVCLCVALVGINVIILESYAQLFPTPIFGQFILIFGVLGAAFLFIINRALKRFKETAEESKKQIWIEFDKLTTDPLLKGKLEEFFQTMRPKLVEALKKNFPEMKKDLKPLIDDVVNAVLTSVKEKIWETLPAPPGSGMFARVAAWRPLGFFGATNDLNQPNDSNQVVDDVDGDTFYNARKSSF